MVLPYKNRLGAMAVAWVAASVLFLFTTCNTKSTIPDTNHIDLTVTIQRFEKDLFACDTTVYEPCFDGLEQKYPQFFPVYINNLLSIRQPSDTGRLYRQNLRRFIANADLRALYDTVMLKYPDITLLEKEFTAAFKYYKYYLPHQPVPAVVTHISEFGTAVATFDSTLLTVSLDMFLGKDFVYYQSIGIPRFIAYRLQQPFIVPTAMKAMAKALYETKPAEAKLIDRMVEEGKLLYFLDKVLPYTPDSVKMGYSAAALQWCYNNEQEMWTFFVEKDLLYNTKALEYMKYITEAPNTPGMPPDAPGQTGVWLGWQIVRKFMQQNPNVTLDQLMQMTDGQEILKRSRYKPSK